MDKKYIYSISSLVDLTGNVNTWKKILKEGFLDFEVSTELFPKIKVYKSNNSNEKIVFEYRRAVSENAHSNYKIGVKGRLEKKTKAE
jgi:hypothetical protein